MVYEAGREDIWKKLFQIAIPAGIASDIIGYAGLHTAVVERDE